MLAPNNGAFEGLFAKIGVEDIAEASSNPKLKGILLDILLNHFLPGRPKGRNAFSVKKTGKEDVLLASVVLCCQVPIFGRFPCGFCADVSALQRT